MTKSSQTSNFKLQNSKVLSFDLLKTDYVNNFTSRGGR